MTTSEIPPGRLLVRNIAAWVPYVKIKSPRGKDALFLGYLTEPIRLWTWRERVPGRPCRKRRPVLWPPWPASQLLFASLPVCLQRGLIGPMTASRGWQTWASPPGSKPITTPFFIFNFKSAFSTMNEIYQLGRTIDNSFEKENVKIMNSEDCLRVPNGPLWMLFFSLKRSQCKIIHKSYIYSSWSSMSAVGLNDLHHDDVRFDFHMAASSVADVVGDEQHLFVSVHGVHVVQRVERIGPGLG